MARYGPVWAQPTDSYPVQTGLTATGRWLREHCENARAKLLILDPLVNAFGASENANEDAARFVADWGDWAIYSDCTVILCHHLGKGGRGFRDASAWSAATRFHWQLSKDEEQNDQLVCLKNFYGPCPPPVRLHRDSTTNWIWQEEVDLWKLVDENRSGPN